MFRFVKIAVQPTDMSTHIGCPIITAHRTARAYIDFVEMAVPEVLAVDTQLHGRGL